MSLYEEVLARAGGDLSLSPKPPRPSASVVLWRTGTDGALELYWVQRSAKVGFMPGWHAFPGGGVHRTDASVPCRDEPAGLTADLPAAGLPAPLLAPGAEPRADGTPGIVVAAVRELFEETGLLLAYPPRASETELDELRRAILDDPGAFGPSLERLGMQIASGRLSFAGRWLTPAFAPRRFDNRFFLLEWPADRPWQPQIWPGELAHGEWTRPSDALAAWRRGDIMTAPPIVHILSVLGDEGPAEGLAALREPFEAELGPFRRIEFRPGVVMFPLRAATLPPATHTNSYLVGTGPSVLVDPGSPFEDENGRLLEALADAETGLGRTVEAIWLTHHHPDHVAGVETVRAALDVPVLAHAATIERLNGTIDVDGVLADGDEHLLGDEFMVEVVHTPGHARGHVALWIPRHRSLVSGDLVSALSTIVIDPPEGNMADYLASLDRAAGLEPRTLFPAHGPVLFPAGPVLDRFQRHRQAREQKILDAYRDGLTEPGSMLETVYDDAPRVAWPLAERQIRAHLEHLRSRGKI